MENAAWINHQSGGPLTISPYLLNDHWWKELSLQREIIITVKTEGYKLASSRNCWQE